MCPTLSSPLAARAALPAVLACVLVAAACGDDVTVVEGTPVGPTFADGAPGTPDATDAPDSVFPSDDSGPAGKPDADEPDSGEPEPTPVVRGLAFVDAFGDDNITCQGDGIDHCTVFVSYNEKRAIQVLYTENGQPTPGGTVLFTVVNDTSGMGWLSAQAAFAGDDGVATVDTKGTVLASGQYAVQASISDPDVPPLYFDIVVTPKSQVPLTVLAKYAGPLQVGSYEVRLFAQAGGSPDCSDLEGLIEQGQAYITSPNTLITQSVKFIELPGLEAAGELDFTIVATSENNAGAVQAWGCVADAQAKWGYSTTVEVPMSDRPPTYMGPYLTTSRFDFISALPESVQPWVYGFLDIFQDPVAGLLSLICDLANDLPVLGDMCELVFNNPADPDIDDLTFLGDVIVDVLNTLIYQFADDTIWGDILFTGKDLADILTAFEVNGTITFKEQPDEDGNWTSDQTYETWDSVTVKWTLGEECDPLVDDSCGVTNFSFAAIQVDDPVVGEFSASVADKWWLTVEPHSLNVKYGALVNYIIQKVLLPLLAGDGSDGGPVIDSYAKLLGMLVGGKECLMPGNTPCCQAFAENIASGGGQLGVDVVESACDALLGLGADLIEDQLLGLDATTGGAFQISTAEPCRFYDVDKDLLVDSFGSEVQPCQWNVDLNLFGATTDMSGDFWGVRAN